MNNVFSKASQKLGPIKIKKRISILSKLNIKDRFRLNELTEGFFVIIYKKNLSICGLKPDFIYASLITLFKDDAIYTQYLAIQTFRSLDFLLSYLISEFKNTKTKDMKA